MKSVKAEGCRTVGRSRVCVGVKLTRRGREARWQRVSRRWIAGLVLAGAGHKAAAGVELSVEEKSSRVAEIRRVSKQNGALNTPKEVQDPPTYVHAKGKIVAVGDLHGDLVKTLDALRLAGVLEEDKEGNPVWCGGDTTVVQLGDVLDRGDCEIGILMLLRDLDRQAKKEGGAVYMLNGNHESLNVCGNFRYVTRGAFYETALAAGTKRTEASVFENQLFARVALFSPGGMVAKELAKNPTVLVVNDTVFAHGGLLPSHAEYGIERINAEMSAWMRGDVVEDGSKAAPPCIAMGGPNSILWNRTLAQETFRTPYEKYYACSLLKSAMQKVGGQRLVVGHTPQVTGCNSECGGQVWRTDVGMSQGVLNALPQVLTIDKGKDGDTRVDVLTGTMQQRNSHNLLNFATHIAPKNRYV